MSRFRTIGFAFILFICVFGEKLTAGEELIPSPIFHPDSNSVRADLQDHWFGRDKGQHLVLSFIISGVTTNILRKTSSNLSRDDALKWGVSFSFSLGVVKEVVDGQKRDNFFSWKDLTADFLGNLLAIVVFSKR